MANCRYKQQFIDRRVFVSGKESILNTHNFVEVGLLPPGGETNFVLAKCNNKDYNTYWVDVTSLIGGALNFSNALTKTGANVTWEGPLIKNTLVDGGSTYDVTFDALTEFSVSSANIITLDGDDTTLTGATILKVQTPDFTNSAREFGLLQNLDTTTAEAEYTPYGFPTEAGLENQILVMNSSGDLEFRDNSKVENTIFVMKNGNDSTGLRERFDLPFLTIEAALTVAVAGDVIVIYPGQYIVSNGDAIIKPYVSIEMIGDVDIVVNDVQPDTFKMTGSNVSITGPGSITLNAGASYRKIKVDDIGGSTVKIDIDKLILNKVSLNWGEVSSLDFKVNYLSNTNCQAISYYQASIDDEIDFRGSAKFRINELVCNITNTVPTVCIWIGDQVGFQTSIDIEINKVEAQSMYNINGFLNTINNNNSTKIKVHVNEFNFTNPSDALEALTPLVRSGGCTAEKDISINGIKTTSLLYKNFTFNAAEPERGVIEFNGKLIDNSYSVYLENIIDFGKSDQEILFKLNLVDETTIFGVASTFASLINITSPDGKQRLTGYFKTVKTGPTAVDPLAAVGYGGTNLIPVYNAATIDNFTVVCGSGYPSFRRLSNDAGLSAPGVGIPNKNSYTNEAVDPANSGPVFLIDAALTIDVAVR